MYMYSKKLYYCQRLALISITIRYQISATDWAGYLALSDTKYLKLKELDIRHYQTQNVWHWWSWIFSNDEIGYLVQSETKYPVLIFGTIKYQISGTMRYQISGNDEIWYLVQSDKKYPALMALNIRHYQIANIWDWWCWISCIIKYQIFGTDWAG